VPSQGLGNFVGMAFLPHRAAPPGLARGVDRGLPWAATVSVLAGVLVTAFSAVPPRLPGIALDSTPLFLLERGGAVIASLIVVTGLVGRTLKRELPTGFSPATGSLTYTEKVQEAASSSDTIAAGLIARLDEQDTALARQRERLEELAEGIAVIAAAEKPKRPPDPPGR
jgi:hypothetical protein